MRCPHGDQSGMGLGTSKQHQALRDEKHCRGYVGGQGLAPLCEHPWAFQEVF